uniref:phospholipase D-like domain-containing protein n=1 Tax=Halorubrum sp. F4 TaxID=2989715 RepID=UPI0024803F58
VSKFHRWLLNETGLIDEGEITLLGSFVLIADDPFHLIRIAVASGFHGIERILRSCLDIEESNLRRREFDSLFAGNWDETVLAPLIGSMGFLTIHPDAVEVHTDRIESALAPQGVVSEESAVTGAYAQVLSDLLEVRDQDCIESLTERLTDERPITNHSEGAIASKLVQSVPVIPSFEDIRRAVAEQRSEYEEMFEQLQQLLTPSEGVNAVQIETESVVGTESISGDDFGEREQRCLLNVIATVSSHPQFARFDLRFVTEKVSANQYTIYQALSSVPGVACEVVDGSIIKFDSVPQLVDGEDLKQEYARHLIQRCSRVQTQIDRLSDLNIKDPSPTAAETAVIRDYETISKGHVEPTYFTYTLPDPDALGEKKMDEYIGDSRGLGREAARLRRWHEDRPSGMRSYTAMTDRLFSIGLERNLDDKVLRIMTPFDDDTFNEYVSQIRRLLEQGFELRLLTRHTKEPWEWRRLQRNLLSEIKQHRDQVTVRTYSRFKQYQRVSPSDDFRELGEFGVHGKVQTIGSAEEGASLLGSANFMTNSYDWNPECGVYTERTQFVDAAIEFFDIVWQIAESDELAIERLQKIPDRQLVPTYYS